MTSQELYTLAKEKVKLLDTGTQILLTPSRNYWLFNFEGQTYIGYYVKESEPKFFKGSEQYLQDKNGVIIAHLQPIKK